MGVRGCEGKRGEVGCVLGVERDRDTVRDDADTDAETQTVIAKR
jgi:hypothetical protein